MQLTRLLLRLSGDICRRETAMVTIPLLLTTIGRAATKHDANGELPTRKCRGPVDHVARSFLKLVGHLSLRSGEHLLRGKPKRFASLCPGVREVQLRVSVERGGPIRCKSVKKEVVGK